MWEIRSSVIGDHLYKDGELIADVHGFYKDWAELVRRLNDLDAFNTLNPIIAMGSGEWGEHTKLMNDVASACLRAMGSEVEATLRSSLKEAASMWTKEWPTERGWYWFYGQTSKMVWDMRPEFIPVKVRKDRTGKPIYVGNGHFLWKGEGARGLWAPMRVPVPPTHRFDELISEILN